MSEPHEPPASPEYHDQAADDGFWEAAVPRREPLRWRAYLPLLAVLLVINVPWYLPRAAAEQRYGGMPLFVWIALATSVAISVLVAVAALRYWDDDDPETDRVEP